MPSVPVRKPEIGRPGTNGVSAVSAPWNASSACRRDPQSGSPRARRASLRPPPAAAHRAPWPPPAGRPAHPAPPRPRPPSRTRSAPSPPTETTMRCLRSSMRNLSARSRALDELQPQKLRPVLGPVVDLVRSQAGVSERADRHGACSCRAGGSVQPASCRPDTDCAIAGSPGAFAARLNGMVLRRGTRSGVKVRPRAPSPSRFAGRRRWRRCGRPPRRRSSQPAWRCRRA